VLKKHSILLWAELSPLQNSCMKTLTHIHTHLSTLVPQNMTVLNLRDRALKKATEWIQSNWCPVKGENVNTQRDTEIRRNTARRWPLHNLERATILDLPPSTTVRNRIPAEVAPQNNIGKKLTYICSYSSWGLIFLPHSLNSENLLRNS
jgi:hypothetical protein